MHASLVLLNLNFALWAWFGVEFHPYLSVIHTNIDLLVPFGQQIARNRPMRVLHTLEAVVVTALADNVSLLHRRVDNSMGAIRCRAILGTLVVTNERFGVVSLIFLVLICGQNLAEGFIRHNQFARVNGAATKYNLGAILKLCLKITLVTNATEGMPALHSYKICRFIIANGAAEVLTRFL